MMLYHAAIEHGTTDIWYGRIIELPGTHARAKKASLLSIEIEDEIRYHTSWLIKHGVECPRADTIEVVIQEEIRNIPELGESGGEVALFEFDRQPVDEELLKSFFSYMKYNRQDLLLLIKSLGEDVMQHIPSGKKRNIIDILNHICNAEEWYKSRLGHKADLLYQENLGMPEDEVDELPVLERLDTVRNACIQTLVNLVPKMGDTVFRRKEYTDYPEEQWTAYKIMRRFLEHEREHYYNIREYLNLPIRDLI